MNPFEDILVDATPAVRAICVALRKLVVDAYSGCTEVVWPRQRIASYGIGPRKMTEHYVYIASLKAHANLGFYRGATLEDPAGLLEGNGKSLRHVKVRKVEAVWTPALAELVRAAIAERRTATKT